MTLEKIETMAESLGWNFSFEGNWITFQTYSKYGQDFNVEIYIDIESETLIEDVREKLIEYYDNFDVDAETYIWLDNDGHGTNGAPYRMMDVWNDMNECHEKIWELAMKME